MKKLLVLPVLLLFASATFAQLKVLNTGNTFVPFGKSYLIGSENAVGNRFRIVHNGGREAVIEYWEALYFNRGDQRSDIAHTMILGSDGDVQMRKNLQVYEHLAVNTVPSAFYELYVNGRARIGSVVYDSDKRYKENIKPMEGDLAKLKKLKPVSYQYKDTEINPNDTAAVASQTAPTNGQREKRNRMGFLAQDFQQVFPDLVYEDENGYLGIDYISLIPSLVEALQEQQVQIDALEEELEKGKKNARTASRSKERSNSLLTDATETVLHQNRPNPFSESTEIDIELSKKSGQAYLYVYDMQGVQKKKYTVKGNGRTSVVIRGGELSAGMYMYALVIGNEVIDTKKMILTD